MVHASFPPIPDKTSLADHASRRSKAPILGLCFLLLTAAHAQETRSQRQLAAELRRLEAENAPLLPEDLERARPPVQDNAAARLIDAHARLPELNDEEQDALDAFTRGESWQEPADPEIWRAQLPAVERLLKVRKEALDVALQALARPALQFPLRFADGPNMDLPHLLVCQDLAELFEARALLLARSGDLAGAAAHVEASWRLARGLENEPGMISHLVMIGLLGKGALTLRQIAALGPLPAEDIARLQELLAGFALEAGPARTLEAERCLGLIAFANIVEAEIAKAEAQAEAELTLLRAHFDRDKLLFLQYFAQALTAWQQPYEQRMTALQHIEEETAETCKRDKYVLTGLLMPVLSRFAESQAKAQTELAMARTALELMLVAAERGSYPLVFETSSELHDARTGQPFGYKRRGKTARLFAQPADGLDWQPSDWVLSGH